VAEGVIGQGSAQVVQKGRFSPKDKKLRYCFFQADEPKMLDCVSASAAIPHIEASIKGHHYPT
jgi:hypothetical protein